MVTKYIFIVLVALLGLTNSLRAQTEFTYNQTTSIESFNSIKNGNGAMLLDHTYENESVKLTLPNFNFRYNNVNYSDIFINKKGWISLGSDLINFPSKNNDHIDLYEYTRVKGNDLIELKAPLIAALFDEFDLNYRDDLNFEIWYDLQTLNNEDVLIIEWNNMQWSPEVAVFEPNARIHFQIRLYENSENIEFSYEVTAPVLFNYDPSAGEIQENTGATIGLGNSGYKPLPFLIDNMSGLTKEFDAFNLLNGVKILFFPQSTNSGGTGNSGDDGTTNIYVSAFQQSFNVYPADLDKQLIRLNVYIPENTESNELNRVRFGTDLLSSKFDVFNLRLFHNTTNTITNSTLIGSHASVQSDSLEFNFSALHLTAGTHYFWLLADISENAIEGNRVDVKLLSYMFGTNNSSQIISPPEALLILDNSSYAGRGIDIPELEYFQDYDKNWSEQILYNELGEIVSHNRVYYDNFGRVTQQHNNTSGNIITTQTIYDLFGRTAIQTLPAVQTQNTYIRYDQNFITNSNNNEYSFSDFDINSKRATPNPLKSTNTLATYYSNNNNLEPYVAASAYPYNRAHYTNNAASNLLTLSMPGEAFKREEGHVNYNFNMMSSGELVYIYGFMRSYIQHVSRVNVIDQTTINDCLTTKVISINDKKETSISYLGPNNIVVAKCMSGMPNNTCATQKVSHNLSVNAKDLLKHTNSFDLHLPKSKSNTLKFTQLNQSVYDYAFFDLVIYNLMNSEKLILGLDYTITNNSGVYAIAFLPGSIYHNTDNYLRIGLVIKPNNINFANIKRVDDCVLKFSYELDYSHWTANYYDTKLNLITSTQPKDIDCNVNPIANYLTTVGQTNANATTNYGSTLLEVDLPDVRDYDRTIKIHLRAIPDASNTLIMSRANPVVNLDAGANQQFFNLQANEIVDINEATGPCNFIDRETIIENKLFKVFFDIYGVSSTQIETKLNTKAYYELVFNLVPYTKVGCNSILYRINQVASDRKYMFDNYMLSDFEKLKYKIVGLSVDNEAYDENNSSHTSFVYNDHIISNYFDLFKLRFDYEIEQNQHTAIHNQSSTYFNTYDAKNQLIETNSQDEGRVKYLYDKEGKLRFTQNSLQALSGKFFYTNYDKSGRVIETGEYNPAIFDENSSKYYFFEMPAQYTGATFADKISVITILDHTGSFNPVRCTDRNFIKYDEFTNDVPVSISAIYSAKNLHNRVSKTWNEHSSTWYSYNYRGELTWTVQSNANFGTKTIDYSYDYFGNVLSVDYQNGQNNERFKHVYKYDDYQRLVEVSTIKGNSIPQLQARYIYYKHGPLKRKELGTQVQGVDYVYTINGWLKSINDPTLTNRDPGKDGFSGANSAFGKDVFGLSIDYFNNDYIRAGTFIQNNIYTANTSENYYDGKIKAIRWQTTLPTSASNNYANTQLAYTFKYDVFAQLTTATFGTVNSGNMNPSNGAILEQEFAAKPAYKVSNLTYDNNGNIKSLKRYGNQNVNNYMMDDLVYNYIPNSNKLLSVQDLAAGNEYVDAIPSNTSTAPQYVYDELGRMKVDLQKNITIHYDNNGKVSEIHDNASQSLKIKFTYNERGQKIKKTVYPDYETNFYIYNTYYVNDLAGNVMAVYTSSHVSNVSPVIQIQEQTIVGMGRIGVHYTQSNQTVYEITDHLGNVRATVSSVKTNGIPEVLSYTDFYPHGGILPGRNYVSSNAYRYDYQGQEKDPETNWSNFELRMYDANLARWMSPDPYGEFHSPYLAMGNNPVSTIDPDGGKTVADPTNIDYDNGRERRVDPFDMVGGSGIREDNIKVGNSLVSLNDDSPYSVEEQIRNLGYIIAGTGMTDSKDISHYTFNIYQNGSDGTLGSFNVSYDSEGNIVKSNNGGAINKARSGGGYNFDRLIDDVELSSDLWAPVGNGADNILRNRGAYMPRGEIYRVNKPITVRTPLFNVNTTSKVLKYARVGGKVLGAANILATGYEISQDWNDGKYKSASARATVYGVAAGAAFIPVVGWGVSIGIGVLDYMYGDEFYNWLEKQ
jgi:RHS repeat-associated protein